MVSANIPWRVLLREELSLPFGVTGPFDLAPLAREASVCLGVLIRDLIMHEACKGNCGEILDVIDKKYVCGMIECCDWCRAAGKTRPQREDENGSPRTEFGGAIRRVRLTVSSRNVLLFSEDRKSTYWKMLVGQRTDAIGHTFQWSCRRRHRW